MHAAVLPRMARADLRGEGADGDNVESLVQVARPSVAEVKPEDRLSELHEELQKGRIVEARLRASDAHIDGLCEYGSGTIYIDPRAAIVSTLLHELIHRRHPSWSESRVMKEEHRLLSQMTPDDVQRWYRKYQKAKRTRATTKHVSDEE